MPSGDGGLRARNYPSKLNVANEVRVHFVFSVSLCVNRKPLFGLLFFSECIGATPPHSTQPPSTPRPLQLLWVEPFECFQVPYSATCLGHCLNSGGSLPWQEVLRSLYPGCPFEREVVGLELVQLVLSELLPAGELDAPTQSKATLSKVRISLYKYLPVSMFVNEVQRLAAGVGLEDPRKMGYGSRDTRRIRKCAKAGFVAEEIFMRFIPRVRGFRFFATIGDI